jgi:hypothetical protein
MANETKPIDTDPHALSTTYPEPAEIFRFQLDSIDTIKESALFVIDTNALLVPYRTGRSSIEEIGKVYRSLVETSRLVVPAQVAREFAHQRAEHLKTTYRQLSLRRDVSLNTDPYPLFEGLKQYEALRKHESEARTKLEDYRAAVTRLMETMRDWRWNDPVSSLYATTFTTGVVIDITEKPEDIQKAMEYRYANRIPPGFRDEKKPDGGIGDLLIWKTILQIGAERRAHLVFVSGDEKADWWHRSDSTALYPRYELVDEYRRSSEGHSFHILPFDQLLSMFGARKEVVEEVRREQHTVAMPASLLGLQNATDFPENVQQAVSKWLQRRGGALLTQGAKPIGILNLDGMNHRVRVHSVLRATAARRVRDALRELKGASPNQGMLIVLATRSKRTGMVVADEVTAQLSSAVPLSGPATVVVGSIRAGEFVPLQTFNKG